MKRGIVKINNKNFPVFLAISESEQEKGLMGMDWPPPSMAFIYSLPKFNSFWMKGTPSPLDIVFCLDEKIIKICKGEPYSTSIINGGLTNLVIEFPYGTCKDNGIKENDFVKLEYFPEENNLISEFKKIFKL